MSGGILRFPWTSQPQTPAGVNRDYNLKRLWVPGLDDLVVGERDLPQSTPANGVVPWGMAYRTNNGSAERHDLSSGSSFVTTGSTGFSLLVKMRWGSTVGDGQGAGVRPVGGAVSLRATFYLGTAGSIFFDFGGATNGTTRVTGTTSTTAGRVTTYLATTGPRGMELWENGVLIASNGANPTRTSSGQAFSVGDVYGGFAGNADYGIVACWDGQIPTPLAALYSGDPLKLFAPIQRTIWVPSAGGGAFTASITEAITLADTASQVASLSASITEAATLSHSQDAIVGYAVSITEAMSLSHSQTNVANFPATITEAMTLADTKSVQFGATSTISEAMTLADSSSNVATLSASITESMTLADSPNASASGDYTATQTEAMSLADSASNVAALSASITESISLADSSSNVAALSRSISEALTLADTVSSSAAGDYTVAITETATLADSSSNVAALSAAITESSTLSDTLSASSPGNFAGSISESLALAEIASNQAALSAAMVEALSLADNAASAWSRVVSLTEAMTLSDSASQALNAIVTESVWWSYSIEPQDLHYSVDPQDLTFSITTLALAGG